MAGKNQVVYGIYSHRSQAEAGVDRLIEAGFRKEDISVLMQHNTGTKDFAHHKATKAPEGTTAGALVGGVIGGIIGLVIGLGAIVVHGLEPLLAAGPVIAALTGVGSGGILGGIIGALVGLGIPEYEARRYEGHVKSGGILASVHCDSREWVTKAKDVLKHTGADDISSSSEAKADFAASDRPYSATEPRHATPLGSLANTAPPVPAPPVTDRTLRPAPAPSSAPVRTVTTVPLADEADFRNHFQGGSGLSGTDYSSYAPAYRYGYHAANDERFRGRSFEEVEPALRTDYAKHYPEDTWDRVKDAVHYGWSKMTQRT